MVSRQDLPRRPPTAKGDLGAIANEFRRRGVGPLMMEEVREIAYRLVPKYNAAVYSEIGNWRHGFDDLVQDVVADSLLGEQQAAYLIETSKSIDEFRRLLTFQVKRRLARRRTRTVIDNLLRRARPILDEPPFRRSERHLQATYLLDGELREQRAATFRELQSASAAIRSIPQTTSSLTRSGSDRLHVGRPRWCARPHRRGATERVHHRRTRPDSPPDVATSTPWRP